MQAIELIESNYEVDNDEKNEIYINAMSGESKIVKCTLPYISGFIHNRILRKECCIYCYDIMKNTTLRHWC